MNIEALKGELLRDEGIRYSPYRDTVGKLTIGVGHNLDDVPISHAAAMQILEDDIVHVMGDLNRSISWWSGLDDVRQRVLANLCFQLGINGLMQFVKMLVAMKDGNFDEAADELLDSKLAKQAPSRIQRHVIALRTGMTK